MGEKLMDTPRTDAECNRILNSECLPDCDEYGHENNCPQCFPERPMAAFARQLERENQELRAALEAIRAAAKNAQCDCTLAERDSGHKTDCWMPEFREAIAKVPK